MIPTRLLLPLLTLGLTLPATTLGCSTDETAPRGGAASSSGGGGAGPVEDFVCPGAVGDVFDPGQVYYVAQEVGNCVSFVGRWCNPYEASAGIRCPVGWDSFVNIRPTDGRLIYVLHDDVGGDTIREYRCDHGCEYTPADEAFVDLPENDPIVVDPVCEKVLWMRVAPTGSLLYACGGINKLSYYDDEGDLVYEAANPLHPGALGFENVVLDSGTLIDLSAPASATMIEGLPAQAVVATRATPEGGLLCAARA